MPPFRIHQTRSKPERILIRLMQGRYIIPQYVAPQPQQEQNPVASASTPVVPDKKQTTISLKQIKQIILLLQQSEHKKLSKLLPPELSSLLTLDEDKVDEVDESEHVEPETLEFPEEDEDDDILIIDV